MMKNLSFLFFVFFVLILTSCQQKHKANFDFELIQGEAPVEVAFKNTSEKAESYYWDFGDGFSSTEENPKHLFNFAGTYNVTLIAYNQGEETRISKSLTLREAPKRIVEIETQFGVMKVELFNFTPKHRDNFIKLAQEGYYDGTLFHRVMQGFMIQGGDPDSKTATPGQRLGMGGPGYTIPAEIVAGAYHYKGALAAARDDNPMKESSGSQFYLVQGSPHQPEQLQQYVNQKAQEGIIVNYSPAQVQFYGAEGGAPVLDMNYTVFGQVIEGLHIIDHLGAVQVDGVSRPIQDIPMKVRVVK